MISFYPGPSQVHKNIPEFVQQAYDSGVMSMNHRSPECVALVKETTGLLKKKLEIPEDYTVFFISAATECWQIIAQSFEGVSYHFYNGSFGEKWFNSTKRLKTQTIGYQFDLMKELKLGELDLSMEKGLICLTQNETSNGTRVTNKRIAKIRKKYPDHLIAVDATSSMAGDFLKFELGDIWYASVQKCFGLPAGLAVMICSPKAIEEALETNQTKYYNSLPALIRNMSNYQPTHTPNVLNIYLLNCVMKAAKPISKVSNQLSKRMAALEEIFDSKTEIQPLVNNIKIRSKTVLTVKGNPDDIEKIKELARQQEIILGNGYGERKADTFRIANFPAIRDKDIEILSKFLNKNLK